MNQSTEMLTEERQGEILTHETIEENYKKHFYIESYGCAMNFSDSEIVASVLTKDGFGPTTEMSKADLILINTCSIREKAELTVRKRLRIFDKEKKQRPGVLVGVLGCMAERLKEKFLEEEKLVDIVVGPDAYRDLPKLISNAEEGDKGVNVFLSREETYADISPVRLKSNGVSAYISIMRGCDNMCSFCVVPFTRGRERSRDPFTIVAEAKDLWDQGYKEVTLLGQNVDSYKWKLPNGEGAATSFADLLKMVADISPTMRVRFMTSHPKDITDEVLFAIRDYDNICDYIHLPVQSGNSRVLELMNRTYDRDWYMSKVNRIYEIIPDCTISSDIIAGFCTETEAEHQQTVEMIKWAKYTMSFMYTYSERPGTLAAKKYADDVPHEVKKRRLAEIVETQLSVAKALNANDIGKVFEVLVDGTSKKSDLDFKGRNSNNKRLVFPKVAGVKLGDYVHVKVEKSTSATLVGQIVEI